MVSNYPAGIDNLPKASPGDTLASAPHSALHNLTSEAVEAVQATLGANPQGSDSTVAERLLNIENSAGGGAVDSVNGKSGAVVLSAGDVGARPAGDVPWGEVSDQPSAFPPAPHTHAIADIADYEPPDLSGYVKTVNGQGPDGTGNVNVTGGGGAVDSVNGQTGDVVLGAGDVGARPAGDVPWGDISNPPSEYPPETHTHTAEQISNATTVGRNLMKASSQANARSAIGAGTSNFSGSYNNLTNRPTIPSTASQVGAVAYEGSTPLKLWTGTQAQYDQIGSPDPSTIYVVR